MNYWGSPCIPHQTPDFMAFRLVILRSTDNRLERFSNFVGPPASLSSRHLGMVRAWRMAGW